MCGSPATAGDNVNGNQGANSPYPKEDISLDNSSKSGAEFREILESSKTDFSAFAIASRASEILAERPLPKRDCASPSMRSAA